MASPRRRTRIWQKDKSRRLQERRQGRRQKHQKRQRQERRRESASKPFPRFEGQAPFDYRSCFGLQKVVSNLVSGIIILLDKSIKPGDVISLGETFGWINSLGARYVSVVTRDGKEYLIPNEDLITGQVVNWSHSNAYVRLDIHFGTAYHDDPHKVRQIAIEAAQSVDRVLSFKPPVCHIVGFGDSSVDYILRFWIEDPTGGLTNIRGNVYLALWDAFQAHEISIPFPQREVTVLPGSKLQTQSD